MRKPGAMVSILSHSSRVMRLASRSSRPASDAHRLRAAVDTVADEIKPPCAEALALQALAELGGELADVARDRFHRADRLGEGAAHLDQLLRTDGIDRFGGMAGRLGKSTAGLRTGAGRQGGARVRQQ